MTVTRVGGVGANLGTTTSGSFSYTFSAHSFAVVVVRGGTIPDTLGCSSTNNTWVAGDSNNDGGGSTGDSSQVFYCINTVAGADTITVTQSATGHGLRALTDEYAGCDNSAPYIDHGTNMNSG